jgi:hypothetical protein
MKIAREVRTVYDQAVLRVMEKEGCGSASFSLIFRTFCMHDQTNSFSHIILFRFEAIYKVGLKLNADIDL